MKTWEGYLKFWGGMIVACVSGMISMVLWISDRDHRLEANELAIERLRDGSHNVQEYLQTINQRLSVIEGKLDVILRGINN
jgi:hypothetical protein